jgi:creatine kinase/arginine kinase
LDSLSLEEKNKLIQDHFLFKDPERFLQASFLHRDWPDGRGIFYNEKKTFIVWINEEDQLRIIAMQDGADIGTIFARLSHACSEISKKLEFAHDSHLGYITTCPSNLGTGLRASVHIYLPELG